MPQKNNCHTCKYARKSFIGDHHKACTHTFASNADVLGNIVRLMSNNCLPSTPVVLKDKASGKETVVIELNKHGVRNGWAFWPFNLDPVWLDKCLLYEPSLMHIGNIIHKEVLGESVTDGQIAEAKQVADELINKIHKNPKQ